MSNQAAGDWKEIHGLVTQLMDAACEDVDGAEMKRRLSIIKLEVGIRLTALDLVTEAGLDPRGMELSRFIKKPEVTP